MSKMQHGIMCCAIFQDLPFEIHVLMPTNIGRSGSQILKVWLHYILIFFHTNKILLYISG